MRRLAAPLIAGALLLLVAGCGEGTIDDARLEKQIHTWAVKKEQADPSVKVTCPSDVPVKAGSTFHCLLRGGGETARLVVTIENDKGDVTWVVG